MYTKKFKFLFFTRSIRIIIYYAHALCCRLLTKYSQTCEPTTCCFKRSIISGFFEPFKANVNAVLLKLVFIVGFAPSFNNIFTTFPHHYQHLQSLMGYVPHNHVHLHLYHILSNLLNFLYYYFLSQNIIYLQFLNLANQF